MDLIRILFVGILFGWTISAHAGEGVIVMPAEFSYYQMSAGGIIETLPDDSEAAKAHLYTAMLGRFDRAESFTVVDLPELDSMEARLLDEHIALFDIISQQAVALVNAGGWTHKKGAFDYTLGPGLAFLADRTDAEKAIFVSGHVVTASGGRVAMAMLAAAAVNVSLDTGEAILLAGQVDLRSGAIEWLDFNQSLGGRYNPRSVEGADSLLERLMRDYPKSRLIRATAH